MTAAPLVIEDEPASMADRAYLALCDQLVMLDIPPLAPIDEGRLTRSLGLGRTPVREALKRLEQERLVVSYPRRGTFATSVEISDLTLISEIRVLLEPAAARRAAVAATPARRAELTGIAEAIRGLDVARTGRTDLMRWDRHVHRSIYRAADNPFLADELVRFHNLATRIHCLFLDRLPRVDRHVGEHADLLLAVVAGDADRAEQVARDHVVGFERAVRAVL